MTAPIAPGYQELELAYGVQDPAFGGHEQAEAVLAGPDGITVLASADPTGQDEHSLLIRLSHGATVQWQRDFAPGQGVGRALAALPSGGFAIAGDLRLSAMEYQGALLIADSTGAILKTGAFGEPGIGGFVTVAACDCRPDGSMLAGGAAQGKGWLLCADAGLHAAWTRLLDDVDDVQSVASLPAGGFAALCTLGRSTTSLGLARLSVFEADGGIRWQTSLPSLGRGELAALLAFPDGSFAATGHVQAAETDAAGLWAVRFEPTGRVAWERRFGNPGAEQRGRAIASLSDGSLILAGDGVSSGGREAYVRRLSADGKAAWERTFGGEHVENVVRGLAPTEQDGVVLAGSTIRDSGKSRIWLLRLDSRGETVWEYISGQPL